VKPSAARPVPHDNQLRPATPREMKSAELFGTSREIRILHDNNEVYTLRRTSTGKLLLTK
jgi:hemin uptake protein HemP